MSASIYAGLLLITMFGALGACGSTGSSDSDPSVAGGSTPLSSAGATESSGGSSMSSGGSSISGGGSSTQAGNAGSAHGGSGGGAQSGAGGGGAGCELPRCIQLCEGGICTCSCEGTAAGGAAGASGSSCAMLNTARANSLQAATSCSPELGEQCAKIVTVPNQCGCATVVNSARPEAAQAAQQAYDAWTLAGCGPYACGARCLEGTVATCQAPGAGQGTCTWSL